MQKRAVYVIFTMIACLATSPAFAKKYYKWVDTDGTTTYTLAKPKQDVPFEIVDDNSGIYTGAATGAATDTAPTPAPAPADKAPDTTADASPAVEERKKLQEAECQKMRERLNILQNSARVRTEEKDGTTRVMTAEEHQAEIDRATTYLKDCK